MAHPSEADLARYAIRSVGAGERTHAEPQDPLRTPFELDRHRIVTSTPFRRLEGKTQVFAPSHHDHFRTRLTHTLEVAQIARCLAVALQANELLAEAIAFAHDLGHPPFGHAGEAALNEAMAAHDGFNHNLHTLRVVEYLEHPFPAFRGLNLTSETRAGLLTHTTRYDKPGSTNRNHAPSSDEQQEDIPIGPSVETQIASISDRIAYNCHDLEDAIGAGFIGLQELEQVTGWAMDHDRASVRDHARNIHAVRRVVLGAMLDAMLTDIIATSRELLGPVSSLEQVRRTTHALVAPSDEVEARMAELEGFLADKVYRHTDVAKMDAKGRDMVLALFDAYRAQPDTLPERFSARIEEQGTDRVICDYIAGMTDRFCTNEFGKLVAK
jgi:dGTPase